MKIELHEIERDTISAFADKNNLTMEVHERARPVGDPARYFAHFKDSDAKEGECCLIGLFGDGRSPDEAIAAYANKISLRILVIGALTDERRVIKVPRLLD